MIKLGVNIDHCATVRQARYRDVTFDSGIVIEPDVIGFALLCEEAGADSITAHLREDRRHITDGDIFSLRKNLKTKLNMEMACADSVIEVALKVKPDYVCLVPENRNEVTTEGGLDIIASRKKVEDTVKELSKVGAVCSLFIDPDLSQIEASKAVGANVVELHTGSFANAWGDKASYAKELKRVARAVSFGRSVGLTVNAGHGINYLNVSDIAKIEGINELNIGHSIISRALFAGIKSAVAEMKALLK